MSAAQAATATVAPTQETNRPIDKVRIGNVTASIWRNASEKGDFYTTTFERSYKDESGAMKNSQSFPRGDLLELAKAADKAHDKILELQRKNL